MGIRRIAYELYCPCSGGLLTEHGCIPPALPDRRAINALASLKLTPREAEVLFWISQGKSNHDIGVILGAKTGTICKHVEHIFGKLNVENRTAAAVVALETTAPARRGLKATLFSLGLLSPVLLRRTYVLYARIVPHFTAKSRV